MIWIQKHYLISPWFLQTVVTLLCQRSTQELHSHVFWRGLWDDVRSTNSPRWLAPDGFMVLKNKAKDPAKISNAHNTARCLVSRCIDLLLRSLSSRYILDRCVPVLKEDGVFDQQCSSLWQKLCHLCHATLCFKASRHNPHHIWCLNKLLNTIKLT